MKKKDLSTSQLLLAGITALAVTTIFLQLGWALVMPAVFGLPKLTFLQALGLLMLSNILLKPGARLQQKGQ